MHEVIRRASMEASARMKRGEPCALPSLLGADPDFPFTEEEIIARLKPEDFTGRCAAQVEAYLESLKPVLSSATREKAEIIV